MDTVPAHFTPTDDGGFMPTRFAQSHWGDDHLNGPAVVGLAAQAMEKQCAVEGFVPVRFTADLFRAARTTPTVVDVRVIRDGRRVHNAECNVLQDDRVVARATLVQYRRSAAPPGQQWIAPSTTVTTPEPDDEWAPFVGSDDGDWSRSPGHHQNASRKRFFNNAINVVAGVELSPFVRAVTLAESASLVTNLGTEGIGYINGDLTVGLSRLPLDEWLLVQGDTHLASDGVAVGTATLFDRSGAFGSAMVTAVANPAAQIDFSKQQFPRYRLTHE